jgi:hypothetical protein
MTRHALAVPASATATRARYDTSLPRTWLGGTP